MDTKIIGTQHGAAARAKLEAAKHLAQRVVDRRVQNLKQVAGYLAGFAQGLVRSGNV